MKKAVLAAALIGIAVTSSPPASADNFDCSNSAFCLKTPLPTKPKGSILQQATTNWANLPTNAINNWVNLPQRVVDNWSNAIHDGIRNWTGVEAGPDPDPES